MIDGMRAQRISEAMVRVIIRTPHGVHREYDTYSVPRVGDHLYLHNYPPRSGGDGMALVVRVEWKSLRTELYQPNTQATIFTE